MSLSETLKQATAEAHRHAESRELQHQLLRGALDSGRLGCYLAQLHCVHALLERLFDEHLHVASLINWSDAQRHSRRLGHDLAALGVATDAIRPMPTTERLFDAIEASASQEPLTLIGFFYVLEGSMNGNRFIVRGLRKSPAAAHCSFTYFDPYGEQQPTTWAAFKTALGSVECDPAQQRAIIDAALEMFGAIARISDDVMSAPAPGTASDECEVMILAAKRGSTAIPHALGTA